MTGANFIASGRVPKINSIFFTNLEISIL
ncbi:uncharacterized protein METZ01_LOCUS309147 [marine metagenome]|uniref:Uncharacterized protein n=1 Tax=marine metagenome TaxID=408172 RepID=A0A382N573_9ZZZZ